MLTDNKPNPDTTEPGNPDNSDDKSKGNSNTNTEPGNPDNSENGVNNSQELVETVKKLQERLTDSDKMIAEMKAFLGQQADEIGSLRKESHNQGDIQKYAETLNDDIFDTDDPVTRIQNLNNFAVSAYRGEAAQRAQAMRVHAKAVAQDPRYSDISWNDLEYYVAQNTDSDIPYGNINTNSQIRKVMDSIVHSRTANTDIESIVKERLDTARKEWEAGIKKNNHPANHPGNPGNVNVMDKTNLSDNNDFNTTFANTMAVAKGVSVK